MARFDKHGCRVPQDLFEAAAWHHHVVATCRRCRKTRIFEPAGLWWLFEKKGWNTNFADAASRLKCSDCGGRPFLSSSSTTATTIELPLPDDLSWKKAVSRFRS